MITTSQKTDLIIQTTRGAVRGMQEDGIGVFRGLPFAEPPVGKPRFRPAVPRRRLDGVRNAIRFGEIVPQTDEGPCSLRQEAGKQVQDRTGSHGPPSS